MRKLNRKQMIIAGGILLIATIAASSYFKSITVETVEVKREAVTATVTEKGKVTSLDSQDIYSETLGKVNKIYVEEGDYIQAGSPLAQVDTSDVDTQISQVQGELKALQGSSLTSPSAGQSQIKQQQIAVAEAKSALEQSQREYDRTNKLFKEGAATQAEYERSQNDVEAKKKVLAQADASLNIAFEQNKGSNLQYQGQKQSLEAKLLSLQNQKQKGTIFSGFSGILLNKGIKTGDYINPGEMLFSVGNMDNLIIETFVITRDIYNIRKGDQVKVVFNTPGGKDTNIEGKITKISPSTVEKTSALGVVEEKVKVSIALLKKPEGINMFPGMEVDVDLVTQKSDDVLAVPTETIYSDKGQSFIWLIQAGKAKSVKVETGVEGDVLTEIKSGLKDGDVVILNPHNTELKEDIKVKKV